MLKDLIDPAGRITMGGSDAHRARRASATATIAQRLMGHGMIVLGKRHTVEFAYGVWGTNRASRHALEIPGIARSPARPAGRAAAPASVW